MIAEMEEEEPRLVLPCQCQDCSCRYPAEKLPEEPAVCEACRDDDHLEMLA